MASGKDKKKKSKRSANRAEARGDARKKGDSEERPLKSKAAAAGADALPGEPKNA